MTTVEKLLIRGIRRYPQKVILKKRLLPSFLKKLLSPIFPLVLSFYQSSVPKGIIFFHIKTVFHQTDRRSLNFISL